MTIRRRRILHATGGNFKSSVPLSWLNKPLGGDVVRRFEKQVGRAFLLDGKEDMNNSSPHRKYHSITEKILAYAVPSRDIQVSLPLEILILPRNMERTGTGTGTASVCMK